MSRIPLRRVLGFAYHPDGGLRGQNLGLVKRDGVMANRIRQVRWRQGMMLLIVSCVGLTGCIGNLVYKTKNDKAFYVEQPKLTGKSLSVILEALHSERIERSMGAIHAIEANDELGVPLDELTNNLQRWYRIRSQSPTRFAYQSDDRNCFGSIEYHTLYLLRRVNTAEAAQSMVEIIRHSRAFNGEHFNCRLLDHLNYSAAKNCKFGKYECVRELLKEILGGDDLRHIQHAVHVVIRYGEGRDCELLQNTVTRLRSRMEPAEVYPPRYSDTLAALWKGIEILEQKRDTRAEVE